MSITPSVLPLSNCWFEIWSCQVLTCIAQFVFIVKYSEDFTSFDEDHDDNQASNNDDTEASNNDDEEISVVGNLSIVLSVIVLFEWGQIK